MPYVAIYLHPLSAPPPACSLMSGRYNEYHPHAEEDQKQRDDDAITRLLPGFERRLHPRG